MALVTRSAAAKLDASSGQFAPQIAGDLYAGEDLDPAAPCYIKDSDKKVYMSNGTAANEAAGCDGFTPTAYKAGEPVTLYGPGAKFEYGTGLAVGKLYIGATAGRLDTVASPGDATGVAKVLHTGRHIQVRSYK